MSPEGGLPYPFGLDRLFEQYEVTDPDTGRSFSYIPNKKQRMAHNCGADEIFFGGATFGGKSRWLLMHTALHCQAWGAEANTVLFRRTFPQLLKTLILECRTLFEGLLGHYKASEFCFEWDNGARTWFQHMETRDDVQNHQGANYTLIGYDELTHFEEDMYTTLWAWLRSRTNPNIHCQMLSASNPGGIGHDWVQRRFISGREPCTVYEKLVPKFEVGGVKIEPKKVRQIYIPAFATDNKVGLDNNPNYLPNLKEGMSDARFKALVEGDWDFFEGMACPEWDRSKHVIAPFRIPAYWKVIRCLDWGYMSPFYVGWLAQDPETTTIYLVDEIYGFARGPAGAIRGAEMSPHEVRTQILSHEEAARMEALYPEPRYGVADPSMWGSQGAGPNQGDLLNQGGVLFRAANRDRLLRAALLHARLRTQEATGKPGFMSFETCRGFNGCVPQLRTDRTRTEDVEKAEGDHPYDAVGYGLVELAALPAPKRLSGEERATLARSSKVPHLV